MGKMTEMYSTQKEVKFVVAEKFTRTLKNKIKSTNISLRYNKMCILINFVTKNKTVHII